MVPILTKFYYYLVKFYILYLITLISLPLQSVAMPHYYGETINALKDGNIPRSKYVFIILLGIWILIQAFSIGISFVDNYIVPKFHSYIRQFFFEIYLHILIVLQIMLLILLLNLNIHYLKILSYLL